MHAMKVHLDVARLAAHCLDGLSKLRFGAVQLVRPLGAGLGVIDIDTVRINAGFSRCS